MSGAAPGITVVGSVNLDLVARVEALPRPGETVPASGLDRLPGGKGANQALAARRLGQPVRLVAAVGADAEADAALALLRAGGVGLEHLAVRPDAGTGLALIAVAAGGENQIVVIPGANAHLAPEDLPAGGADVMLLGVLEVPVGTLAAAVARHDGPVCLNLAPARPVPALLLERPDVLVVNESELAVYGAGLTGRAGWTAVTLGAAGAQLWRGGALVAACAPPPVTVVDTVGAGDTFVAALAVATVEAMAPAARLRFAVGASALAVTRAGAQPALPWRAQVDALVAREDW